MGNKKFAEQLQRFSKNIDKGFSDMALTRGIPSANTPLVVLDMPWVFGTNLG